MYLIKINEMITKYKTNVIVSIVLKYRLIEGFLWSGELRIYLTYFNNNDWHIKYTKVRKWH